MKHTNGLRVFLLLTVLLGASTLRGQWIIEGFETMLKIGRAHV